MTLNFRYFIYAVLPAIFAVSNTVHAQRGGGGGGRGGNGRGVANQTAQAAAPVDLTGYWVSLVTADWRWRMVTPAKGDYQGVQLKDRKSVV